MRPGKVIRQATDRLPISARWAPQPVYASVCPRKPRQDGGANSGNIRPGRSTHIAARSDDARDVGEVAERPQQESARDKEGTSLISKTSTAARQGRTVPRDTPLVFGGRARLIAYRMRTSGPVQGVSCTRYRRCENRWDACLTAANGVCWFSHWVLRTISALSTLRSSRLDHS